MTEPVTLTWPHAAVALITVDDPDTPNHNITCRVAKLIAAALEAARDGGARVQVLASGRDGFWLNHAYVRDLADLIQGRRATGNMAGWNRAPGLLADGDVVSIAAISGQTSGGGCELGWACDLRIAEERASFSQPEVALGGGPGIGGLARLARLIGRTVAAEMVLTGLPVSARRMYELGGVNHVVPDGQSVARALDMARHMVSLPAHALAGVKRMLVAGDDLGLHAALESDSAIAQSLFAQEESCRIMRDTQDRFDAGEGFDQVYWAAARPLLADLERDAARRR
jgi:enoyl-CoA hydratase/carnithine racemase